MMKKIALSLVLALSLAALAACSHYVYTPAGEQFTPGEYTHTVDGHNGKITVKTTLDKNRVTAIEVLAHEESESIGDAAMKQVARAIIDKQSFEVDAVSGATFSSTALMQAVALAVRDAGGDAPEISMELFATPTPEPETPAGGFPAPPFVPGEYTGRGMGFGGEVTVTVVVTEDEIVSVTALGKSESDGIGSRAIASMPDAFLEAGTDEVDVVSGATLTSNALKMAFLKAMEQAK